MTATPGDDGRSLIRFFFGACNLPPFFFDAVVVAPAAAPLTCTVSTAASAELLLSFAPCGPPLAALLPPGGPPAGIVSGWRLAAVDGVDDAMMDSSIRLLRLIFSARSCSS
jgi:hypothetical protein